MPDGTFPACHEGVWTLAYSPPPQGNARLFACLQSTITGMGSMRNLIACRWLLIAAASFFATAATAQDVASVTLNPSEKTVTVDSSFYMGATAFDSANQPVPDEPFTWASTNRAVARVD